eukprot:755053-Rhodomonas_salina.1
MKGEEFRPHSLIWSNETSVPHFGLVKRDLSTALWNGQTRSQYHTSDWSNAIAVSLGAQQARMVGPNAISHGYQTLSSDHSSRSPEIQ